MGSAEPLIMECPSCGYRFHIPAPRCPQCNHPVVDAPITTLISRRPFALSVARRGRNVFPLDASAILQFLPSGVCVSLALESPIILGRLQFQGIEVLDLNSFNATQHGVSRRHCLLRRRGTQLVASDIGSTNGTYLNGERLNPQEDYVLSHGDRLTLGTLHMTIFFSCTT